MTRRLVFRPAARAEFEDGVNWYGRRGTRLAKGFTHAVQRVLTEILSQPDFYPEVAEDIREAMVHGFPYCVYYLAEADQVVVLSVFHTSRDPSIWRGRA